MPVKYERVDFDTSEFIEGRTALSLDELGIHVRADGSDWGESDVELFLVKQSIGEIPAYRHPPNRTVTLKLVVGASKGINLAEAVTKLQQKIGTLQRRGGWVRRTFTTDDGFTAAVGYQVKNVSLAGLQGWLMGHRSLAPEVTMVLTTGPYCYSTKEEESTQFVEETKRSLVYSLAKVKGTAPGLRRLEILNTNTAGNWQGLIWAEESDYSSGANTAEMRYAATSLALLGGSAQVVSAESENALVVRNSRLTKLWQAVLGSKISSFGHMSHTGSRRMKFRVKTNAGEPGAVAVKLEWRALGSSHWTSNETVLSTVVGGWELMDLGDARPQGAARGNQTWEWRLCVKKTGTVSVGQFDVDEIYPLPTEQYLHMQSPAEYQVPTEYKAVDDFSTQSAGTLVGQTEQLGGTYLRFPNADTTDPEVDATNDWLKRTAVSDSGTIKGGLNGSGVGTGVIMADQAAVLTMWQTGKTTEEFHVICRGFLMRCASEESYLRVCMGNGGNQTGLQITKVVGSVATPLLGVENAFDLTGVEKWRFMAQVIGERCTVFIDKGQGFEQIASVSDSALNTTSGALKQGTVSIYDENFSSVALTRLYDEYGLWKPTTNVLVYAGSRGIELRSDGCYRQDESEDTWGRGTPLGFLPIAIPSGLEERPSRGILIPTQGDLGSTADTGTNKIKVKVFTRPGYHFTAEAT